MRCTVLAVALCLFAPATASARKAEDTFFNSVIPIRVDHLIGFTPTTFAIHPAGERVKPITVRVGGKTHRYIFGNAAAVVGPVGRHLHAQHDPPAALPEPSGDLPRPPADLRGSAATSACARTSAATPTCSP